MCGVFGFITTAGEGPDLACLKRLALITQSRGEHAFGLAWVDAEGELRTFKQAGSALDHLEKLEACRDAVIVAGHCRWATHGSPADNRNNHPHAAGGGWIVHNGVVTNYREILRHHALRPKSACDSEAIGLLIGRRPGSITQRAAWAMSQVQGEQALLGVWRDPARLLVARRGRPLHWGGAGEGYYFASLAEGLPAPVREVGSGTRVIVLNNEGVRLEDPPKQKQPAFFAGQAPG